MTSKQKVLASACAVGVMSNGGVIMSPVLPGIVAAFPEIPVSTIQMIVTIPALAMVPAALITGGLRGKYGARRIYMICLLILSAAGILPVLYHSFPIVFLSRVFVGCAIGAMVPIANAEIAVNFTGTEKDRAIGIFSAVSSISGAVMMLISGVLSAYGWHYSFTIYLISILQLGAVILWCPKERSQEKTKKYIGRSRLVLNRTLLFVTAAFLVYMTFLNTFSTNIAIFITQEGVGKGTISGVTSALFLFSGFLAGLSYEKIASLVREQSFTVGFLFSALGLLIVAFSKGILFVFLGAIIGGFGMGVVIPAGNMMAAGSATEEHSAGAIAISTSGYRLAQFLTPLVVTPLSALVGGYTARSRFAVSGIVLIAFTVCVYYALRRIFITK